MKKKVLHVLKSNSYSGAENVVITIIKNTKKNVDSVYLSVDGSIREKLSNEGIEFYGVANLSVKNIKKAIRDIKPDLIHTHDFTAGILTAASTSKIPIINHLHNNPLWIRKINLKTIIYRISTNKYKKILTVSSAVMDEYIFGKSLKSKNIIVDNPIDIQEICEKLQINNKNQYSDIVFLGRLTEQKNPIFFIKIIAGLVDKIPELSVNIIGDGELKNHVESEIKKLNVDKNVKLCGFVDNPYDYLNKTKILCIPSLWEGYGLVAVEALVFGKPVITSGVGGLSKIVVDSCGSICSTLEEYQQEIYKYLTDEKYYKEKSEGALKRAKSLDNIEKYIENLICIYEEVMK